MRFFRHLQIIYNPLINHFLFDFVPPKSEFHVYAPVAMWQNSKFDNLRRVKNVLERVKTNITFESTVSISVSPWALIKALEYDRREIGGSEELVAFNVENFDEISLMQNMICTRWEKIFVWQMLLALVY